MFESILNVVGKVSDKFFPDKTKELEFKNKLALAMMEEASKDNSEFKKFMLGYEGKLEDIPKSMQILRTSVRPVITYTVVGAYVYGFLHPTAFTVQQMSTLSSVTLLILAFWFGERTIQHLGLVDVLKEKVNAKKKD